MDQSHQIDGAGMAHLAVGIVAVLYADLHRLGVLDDDAISHAMVPIEQAKKVRQTEASAQFLEECLEGLARLRRSASE